MSTQIIYFDQEDADIDGMGWNIVALHDDDNIAVRFATLADARRWCWQNNFEFRVEAQ